MVVFLLLSPLVVAFIHLGWKDQSLIQFFFLKNFIFKKIISTPNMRLKCTILISRVSCSTNWGSQVPPNRLSLINIQCYSFRCTHTIVIQKSYILISALMICVLLVPFTYFTSLLHPPPLSWPQVCSLHAMKFLWTLNLKNNKFDLW